jgi:hypothetical protein
MPTTAQAFACVRVCQRLSSCYQPIHLFRYDPITTKIYILAGITESIELEIRPDGEWRFIND